MITFDARASTGSDLGAGVLFGPDPVPLYPLWNRSSVVPDDTDQTRVVLEATTVTGTTERMVFTGTFAPYPDTEPERSEWFSDFGATPVQSIEFHDIKGVGDVRSWMISPDEPMQADWVSAPTRAEVLLGNDLFFGSSFDDSLHSGSGDDMLDGKAGGDFLNGGDGADTIKGGNGRDLLEGGLGQDRVLGGRGNDTLQGGAGDDSLLGGSGDDMLFATSFLGSFVINEVLKGGAGDDSLFVRESDTDPTIGRSDVNANGGAGTDNLVMNLFQSPGYAAQVQGVIRANLGSGLETHSYVRASTGLPPLREAVVKARKIEEHEIQIFDQTELDLSFRALSDARVIWDRSLLTGITVESAGRTYDIRPFDADGPLRLGLTFAGGNDAVTLTGPVPVDGDLGLEINTGAGTDTVIVDLESPKGVVETSTIALGRGNDIADLGRQADDVSGGSGADTISSGGGGDTILGGAGSDRLNGGNGGDFIGGGGGNDTLRGGGGNDTLVGGAGVDVLIGGPGRDEFQFNIPLHPTVNVIEDFSLDDDRIVLIGRAEDYTITLSIAMGPSTNVEIEHGPSGKKTFIRLGDEAVVDQDLITIDYADF